VTFSCLTSKPYSDFAYKIIPIGNDSSILWKDVFYDGYTPYALPPSDLSNLNKARVTLADDACLENLKIKGINFKYYQEDLNEFYYSTSYFSNPNGKLKHKINKFSDSPNITILNSYDKEKISEFYYQWRKQKPGDNYFLEEDKKFFFYCLENLENYEIKQVYIEQDNTLVGLAWGIQENEDGWNALFIKNNHAIHWLNYYLLYELSRIFETVSYFTFGTDAREPRLNEYKTNLHPYKIKTYHSIIFP
jgi:hypothetical protein